MTAARLCNKIYARKKNMTRDNKGNLYKLKNFRAGLAQAAPLASKRSKNERKYHYFEVP